jgi:hypothetical protein
MKICVHAELMHTGKAIMTPPRPLRPNVTSMLVPAFSLSASARYAP